MFGEIPVLPVVVPVAAVTFALLLRSLHRRDQLSVARAAVALALCVYVAGVVANTVFPVFLDKPRSGAPWDAHLALVPLAGYEVDDAVMNVLVFVPFGVLVPLVVARAWRWRALAVVAGLSLAIEVVQLVTAHLLGGGHIADVNDLLFNVVGGSLGLALVSVVSRVPALGTRVDRFRWHDAAPRTAGPPASALAHDGPV